MPKVVSKIEHELGQQEAIQRLKKACEWAHGVSDLKETWSENVMEFSASIQGIRIDGNVEVAKNSVKFTGKIPVIALPFKSWIPNILRNALKDRKTENGNVHTDPNEPVILYLHIPKAGGTTLSEFIYNQCKSNDDADEGLIKNGVFFFPDGFFRENESESVARIKTVLDSKPLRAITGHFAFGIHELINRPFHYVTILREPIKRVVSLYHYLKLEEKMSLKDFAKSPPFREIDNDQTRRIAGINPEIGKVSEKDLETAKGNLSKYFAVSGTTERFDEVLALLRQTFNWSKDVASFPRNVGRNIKQSISSSAYEAIKSRNLFDIELHNFANKLMDEMIAGQGSAFLGALEKQRALNSF